MTTRPRSHPASPEGAVDTPARIGRAMARALLADGPVPLLDPACGTGELLLAAVRELGVGGAGPTSRREWIRTRVFGLELSDDRARRTRERLRAALECRAGSSPARALERNIRCADALDPDVPWPPRTHVLANPPWVSFSGRQSAELPPERAALYRASWASFAGWPSLHGAFLERIARHIHGWRGRARVLAPGAVCELDGYRHARAIVGVHCSQDDLVELGEDAFDGVVQPAVVLALSGRRSVVEDEGAPWRAAPGDAEAELVTWLERFPRLPPRSFADPGVHTGNAARELVFDAAGRGRAAVRVGRDLGTFALAAGGRHLRTDLAREPGDGRVFRIPPLESQRSFPVLIRQTASRPIAALHEPPGYFRNSLLACRAIDGLDPAFVVAVLNGPVAATWHRLQFRDARQRSFPQVKVKHLATQPFPIVRREERPELHDEVVRRVRSLRPGSTDFERSVAEIEARVLGAFELPDRAATVVGRLGQASERR